MFQINNIIGVEQVNNPSVASEFAATVAHEMRTPINSASGFVSFLLQDMAGPLSLMQRDLLCTVAASLDQAQTLIEDLLCMSQAQRGQLNIEHEPVELKGLVRQTLKQLAIVAQAANVHLEEVNLEGEEFVVQGAANRLLQCLRNLVTNAIKFSPIGGTVTVAIEKHFGEYRVVVEDEGPGISPENIKAIFERGFQENRQGYHHLAGYGLGLSITKDLVERHKGHIGVESVVGQGSRFWISLPQVKTEELTIAA